MSDPTAVVTLLLLAVIGYVTYRGLRDAAFQNRYLFSPGEVLGRRQYERLVTSGFLHLDWVHFGVNAFTLYSFGGPIETAYGPATLLIVFLASVIGGSLLALWLHRNHEYAALGASGGACGVLFAHIFLLPGGAVMLLFLPIPIPAALYAILFLVYEFYGFRRARDNIGHDAHLGGAIVGLLTATALYPWIVPASPRLYGAVMAAAGAMFVYFYMMGRSPRADDPWSLPALRGRLRVFLERRKLAAEKRRDAQVDRLLAKISEQGMASLTDREKALLREATERRRGR